MNKDILIKLIRQTNRKILEYLTKPENRIHSILILLLIIFIIIQSILRTAVYERSDFNLFIDPAIDAKFFGNDPFRNWLNSYNAFFYAIMSLLSPFARWFSILIWTLVSMLSFIYSIAIIHHLLPEIKGSKPALYLTAPLLLLLPVFDNFQLGQTNMLMMFAVLVSIFYLESKQDFKAGVALGFAIAYKVTPLLFVIYFLLRKRYKAAFYAVISSLAMMILVPMLFYSATRSIDFFESWREMVLAPFFTEGDVKTLNAGFYHTNQSLDAFINRHFTMYGIDEYGGLHHLIDPANLTPNEANLVSNIIKLIVMFALGVLCFFNRLKNNRKTIGEVSLFMMAILLLSPSSWLNHFILLTPAFVYIVHLLKTKDLVQFDRRFLLTSLIAAVVLICLGLSPVIQSFSVYFIALAILFISLVLYQFKNHFQYRI